MTLKDDIIIEKSKLFEKMLELYEEYEKDGDCKPLIESLPLYDSELFIEFLQVFTIYKEAQGMNEKEVHRKVVEIYIMFKDRRPDLDLGINKN